MRFDFFDSIDDEKIIKDTRIFKLRKKKQGELTLLPVNPIFPKSSAVEEAKPHSIDKILSLLQTDGQNNYNRNTDKYSKKDKKKKKKKKKNGKIDKINKMNIFSEDLQKQIKHDKDVYIKRFSGNFEMVKDFMIDIESKIRTSEDYIDELRNAPGRGSTMAISNQNGTVAQLMGMKLQAMKQVMDLNKTISDYEIKQQDRVIKQEERIAKDAKEAAIAGSEEGNESIIHDIFKKLSQGDLDLGVGNDDSDSGKKRKKKRTKEMSLDFLDDRAEELDSAGNLLNDSERAIVYENQDIELVLYHVMITGRSKVVAIDEHGYEITDYPIPSLSTFGKFTIHHETNMAEDSLGRKYRVIFKDALNAEYLANDGMADDIW